MGPKPKTTKKKKKNPVKKTPTKLDPKEIVTELMRQFFEFQLADTDKKIGRLSTKIDELKSGTTELEEKITAHKKEKDIQIAEKEIALEEIVQEKIKRREETRLMGEKIKRKLEESKERKIKLVKDSQIAIEDYKVQLENANHELQILEDYRQNKEVYKKEIDAKEEQIQEDERQHQRNLFVVEKRWDMAKSRVKKELESRLLSLSIEFQQNSQKKLGNPCHRITQENKAIMKEIYLLEEELEEYEENQRKSRNSLIAFKTHESALLMEKDKAQARTMALEALMKKLSKHRMKLSEELLKYAGHEADNRSLLRKLKVVEFEVDKKIKKIDEINKSVKERNNLFNNFRSASSQLIKVTLKIRSILKRVIKLLEEASALRVIPPGGLEDEKDMAEDFKLFFYRRRRDAVFAKQGKILNSAFEMIANAQVSEEEKHLLSIASTESFGVPALSITHIDKAAAHEREPEVRESLTLPIFREEKSALTVDSDRSLPRSISERSSEETRVESEGEFEGEQNILDDEISLPTAFSETTGKETELEGDDERESNTSA